MLLCSVAAGCSVSTLSTPAVPPTLPPSQVSEAAISDGLSHLLGFNAPALGLLPAVEETKLEPSAQPPTDEPLAISKLNPGTATDGYVNVFYSPPHSSRQQNSLTLRFSKIP